MICEQVDDLADAALRVGVVDVDAAGGVAAGRGLRILAGRRFAAAHEDRRQVGRALGIERRFHRSGQHDVVVEQFDGDVGVRDEAPEIVLEAGNVALDGEIEADDLLAVRAEDEDVGFADALAEQIDAACRAGDRIGDRGIGDQYVVGVGRQVDDDRLVEAELDALPLAAESTAHERLPSPRRRRDAAGAAAEAGRASPPATAAACMARLPNGGRRLKAIALSFPCPHFGDFARLDEPDGAAAAIAGDQIVGLVPGLFLRVDDRAQRQRQPVGHLLRDRDDLRLLRRELQRRRLADLDLLAFLVLLDRLVDRQHADVLEDGFGDEAAAAVGRCSAAARHDHVDVVVRKDEAAGRGVGRDLGGDRALARGQDRRHEALAFADQLRAAQRLAGCTWRHAPPSRFSFSIASGSAARVMKFAFMASGGHACQSSWPPIVAPIGTSAVSTRTSDSSIAGCCGPRSTRFAAAEPQPCSWRRSRRRPPQPPQPQE